MALEKVELLCRVDGSKTERHICIFEMEFTAERDAATAFVMESANAKRWKVTMSDAGAFVITELV